ncbi:MAG: putative MATE family efflux protein [Paracoccaceae bacterium]|jgi:putative MATE family efflux protein
MTKPASAAAGRFTTGSTMRHVAVMTGAGAIGLTLMFLVDAVTLLYISMLQVEALTAAVGYAWTIQFFIVSVGLGFSIAATALVSRALGARDREAARRAATSALATTFLILCALSGAAVFWRHDLLTLLGAEGEALEAASSFILLSGPSMPLMSCGMIGASIMRAEGDAKRSMLITMASGFVSIVLDPILIFDSPLGLPIGAGMGIEGAAIAMTVARAASGALGLWGVVVIHNLAAPLRLAGVRRELAAIMAVAGPATLTQLSTPFANFLLTRAVSEHGDGAMAGWSVTTRLTVLAFGGIFALSSSIGGIIGQNYGAGEMARVRQSYRDALLFCAIYVTIAWALLATFSGYVAAGFSLTPDGAEVVDAFTHLAAGAFILVGGTFVANAAFNVMGRPIISTLMNWSRDGIATPIAIMLLAAPFAAPGVIYAQGAAGVAVGVVAVTAGWIFVRHRKSPLRAGRTAAPPATWAAAPSVGSARAAAAIRLDHATRPPAADSPGGAARD